MKNQHRSLASELLRQLMFIATVPILITSIFFIVEFFPEFESNTARHQVAVTNSLTQQTTQHLHQAAEQVQFFLEYNADLQETGALVHRFLEWSPYFKTLYQVNSYNHITHIGIKDRDKVSTDKLYTGVDLTRSTLFRNLYRDSKAHWSNVFLSIVTQQLSVAFIVPDGRNTWVAEMAVEQLPELSPLLTDDKYLVMIMDRDTQLIAHPDLDLVQQQVKFNTLPFFNHNNQLVQSEAEFEWQDKQYAGSINQVPELGWYVIVAESHEQFTQTLTALVLTWLALLLLIIVSAVFYAYRRARGFSSRFEHMNAQARSIAKGEYDQDTPTFYIDEFNELSHNLSIMAEEIRHREEQINTQELQLRNTLESTPKVAVQWYNERGQLNYWNQASANLFGFSSDEAMGKRLNELILNPQATAQFNIYLKRLTLQEADSQDFELPFHTKSQDEGVISGTLFRIPGQTEDRYACMCVDITRQREVEADIRSLNQELEKRIKQRTEALQDSNSQLQNSINKLNTAISQWFRADKRSTMASLVTNMINELSPPLEKAYQSISSMKDRSEELCDRRKFTEISQEEIHEFLGQTSKQTSLSKYNLKHTQQLINVISQVALENTQPQMQNINLMKLVNDTTKSMHDEMALFHAKIVVSIPQDLTISSSSLLLEQVLQSIFHDTFWQTYNADAPIIMRIMASSDQKHTHLTINRERPFNVHKTNKALDIISAEDPINLKPSLSLLIVNLLIEDLLGGSINIERTAIKISLPHQHDSRPSYSNAEST